MRVAHNAEIRFRLIATGPSCASLPRAGLRLHGSINDDGDRSFAATGLECKDTSGPDQLTVGPWLPQLPEQYLHDAPAPPAPDVPASSLEVSISGVVPAPPGGVVTYDVTLRNMTDDDISLTPCPVYRATLIQDDLGVQEFHRLNCEAAPSAIPARGAVTFAMAIRSAADLTSGVLGWDLGHFNSDETPKDRVDYRSS